MQFRNINHHDLSLIFLQISVSLKNFIKKKCKTKTHYCVKSNNTHALNGTWKYHPIQNKHLLSLKMSPKNVHTHTHAQTHTRRKTQQCIFSPRLQELKFHTMTFWKSLGKQ